MPPMSDPTVIILQACFFGAVGIFALCAAVRALAAAFRPATEPPPVPSSRVPVWPYVHIDLLWMGFIFLTFYSISIGSARVVAAKTAMPITPQGLLSSIGFHLVLAGMTLMVMVWRIRPVAWLGLRWPNWKRVFLIGPLGVVAMWLLALALNATAYPQWIKSLGVEPMQDSVKLLQNSQDPLILGLMSVAAMFSARFARKSCSADTCIPPPKNLPGHGWRAFVPRWFLPPHTTVCPLSCHCSISVAC